MGYSHNVGVAEGVFFYTIIQKREKNKELRREGRAKQINGPGALVGDLLSGEF